MIHILRTPGRFIGQVRANGARNWHTVTGKCATSESALVRAAGKFAKQDKRVRVLFVPSGDSYYAPHVCIEARRV